MPITAPAEFLAGKLRVFIQKSTDDAGRLAAQRAAEVLRTAITERGAARLLLATGNSQYAFIRHLATHDIEWEKVTGFHLDEYIGIDADHPASFRRWMRERVEEPLGIRMHYLAGDAADAEAECLRYEQLLREAPLDLVCLGIGENGHLAFNEPGEADFQTPRKVAIVTLNEKSVNQQVNEGHFPTAADVPRRALSLTVPALLDTACLIASVPEARKAEAVYRTIHDPISEDLPATILREQPGAFLYLDEESASMLEPELAGQ